MNSSVQVLLDSEGIEASAQSDQYMAQLFSMCILFSSLFVYNHKGFLEARAFKELSLVATILQDITAGALFVTHSLGAFLSRKQKLRQKLHL